VSKKVGSNEQESSFSMIGIEKVLALVMGLEHFLAPQFHSDFNLRKKNTEKFAIPMISIFLHGKKLSLPFIT